MDIESIKYLLSRRVAGDNSLEEDCLLVINELQDRLRTAEANLEHERHQLRLSGDCLLAERNRLEAVSEECDKLRAKLAECDGQDHVIEFVTNAAGFLDAKFNSYQPKAGDKLYAHPPQAATRDCPTDIQVYQWFQEATVHHHIEENGEHISKRAMFVAKKAWEAALLSTAPAPVKSHENWKHVCTIPTGLPNHGCAHFYEPIVAKFPRGDSDE